MKRSFDGTDLTERMKEVWRDRTPARIDEELYHDAAVFLPIVKKEGELYLLLEIRADRLKTQPGEICFPGGSVEPGEAPVEAAVRETEEELLISREQIEVIAPMDILQVPANMTVYPFLGEIKEYRGTFSADEVREIRQIPLAWFLEQEPQVFETKVLTVPGEDFPYSLVPGGKDYKWRQGSYKVLFYRCGDLVIWGMTAKILRSFTLLCRKEVLPQPPRICGSGKKRTR